MRIVRWGAVVAASAMLAVIGDAQGRRTENVVLVTLDGARWQEIFTGLDEEILRASAAKGAAITTLPVYTRFTGVSPEERRAKLMPFLWRTLVPTHGVIAGNRASGSVVSMTNRHWFSYPGYSEILTGQAHDDTIKSNDPTRNPYPSILQFVRRKLKLDRRQVASFASWDVFSAIVENEQGDTTVNAGAERYDSTSAEMRLLNELMLDTVTPWDHVRHDAYTFRFALEYLRRERPRMLYVAFDETDDWAHDGRYDRVLDTLHRTDGYLRQIWEELQRQPQYRDRTSLIVTVDHGRGRTGKDWRNHGKDVVGADEIWFAIASPDVARRGEWRNHPPLFQNQFAATVAWLLGLDYAEQNKEAGRAIVF